MVIAPHPDDESLACGGLIQRAVAAGADVCVVIATRGDANPWPQRWSERRWRLDPAAVARWGALRTSEARAALEILGVADDRVCFLQWADQGLTTRLVREGDASVAKLREFVALQRPTLVVMPDIRDSHPDHSALAILVEAALRAESSKARVLTYWLHGRRGAPVRPSPQVTLSPSELAIKRAAALSHVSQTHFGRSRLLRFVDVVERFLEPGWPRHEVRGQWRWRFVARRSWSMAAARRVHVVAVSATGALHAVSFELRGAGRDNVLRVTRPSRLALEVEIGPPWPQYAIVLAKLGTDHRINVFDSFAWTGCTEALQESIHHAALPTGSRLRRVTATGAMAPSVADDETVPS
ncbi:PIG-L deacetylase family protein [Cognatiluteimonas profundi]|uniref:PIG-L deacetylase family protein n=1 Tax=Cognatiluteimonas profundi TaxID=2594501 RepID=UPI00131AD8CE|nr:PIG-L family deacetylase [Lysobacter profundi]